MFTFGVNIIPIVNGFLKSVGVVMAAVLSLLPQSPFNYTANFDTGMMGWLNWLMPVGGILTHLAAYLLAVTAYYVIKIPLRWIKAVA